MFCENLDLLKALSKNRSRSEIIWRNGTYDSLFWEILKVHYPVRGSSALKCSLYRVSHIIEQWIFFLYVTI